VHSRQAAQFQFAASQVLAAQEEFQRTKTVCRSNIELHGLNWDYAAWWYSLMTPVTTGFRRTDRRPTTPRTSCASTSGGRCCRD
jgi:hypothetical protein